MKTPFALVALPSVLAMGVLPVVAAPPAPNNGGVRSTVSGSVSLAAGVEPIRFVVIDPLTKKTVPGAAINIETPLALGAGGSKPIRVKEGMQTVNIPLGTTTLVVRQTGKNAPPAKDGKPKVKDIYIKVTATRVPPRTGTTAAGTTRTTQQLNTFVNRASNDTRALTRGQSGVASDSNGQQHVRGEHADISFVVDGVPLPDTLSGRQGSVVVASTIRSLDILTGGYAPEFGGQTAAVLDVQTLPGAAKASTDLSVQGGSYNTFNGDLTASGPLGKRSSYVINVSADSTDNALEPQQPDQQTAFNSGSDQSYFAKFRMAPRLGDALTITLSRAPSKLDLSNRTGLSSRFASAGQGYGFLGLRNADGTRPDVTEDNAGTPGADPLLLASQQDGGQQIYQSEVNEFATLSYRHAVSARDTGQLSAVILHSGQDLKNRNPTIDLNNLPVDNSIEFNPTAKRDVYHYQVTGDFSARRGSHQIKTGFLNDQQEGDESYQLIPGSQLALNELAAVAPSLAPDGEAGRIDDVDGNPVYTIAAGATSPILKVHRSGFYRAAFLQDTWQPSKKFTVNYGLRYDWFRQTQDLGQEPVDKSQVSPRLNFSYGLAGGTLLRWSYNHLFNIPPLAQGAVVGAPIQPETLDQYDISIERRLAPTQTAKAAYYYKNIRNQVDTGLLIPGSQIGLYSAVNLQYGGVHGIELSYEVSPPRGVGLDSYINYTYSIAKPNGLDNTGAPVPEYNDHDQRHTLGAGLAYLWKGGASAAFTLNYGSGLASSPIPPDTKRIARSDVDMHLTTGPKLFNGRGGLGFDVSNLFDSRQVINFQSAFSGTRFQQGRRIQVSAFGTF